MKQSEVMELVAMSAFAVYANIIADATAMEPDEMFQTLYGELCCGCSRDENWRNRVAVVEFCGRYPR